MHRKLPVRILMLWLSAVSFAGPCLPAYAQDRQLTEERLVDEIGSSGKSVIWNGVTPNGATGWVTLHSLVPSTVHDDVYMIVMNTKTLQSYGAFLTEMNDYAQMLCLPSGDYVIVTGGLVNQDSDDPDENLFFFEPEQIHVEAGVSSLYSVRLHDSENPTRRDYADLAGTLSEEEAKKQSEELLEAEKENGSSDERDVGEIYEKPSDDETKPATISPIEENRKQVKQGWTWWQILLFTILLAMIPAGLLYLFVKKHGDLSFKIDR